MFVKNDINEVVNLNHVLAMRVYDDREPYEIHLFTEDFEFVLTYQNADLLNKAKSKLLKALRKVYPRWIETSSPDYYFRSDKVVAVRNYATNVQVQMINRNFIVYANIKDQVIESLKEFVLDNSAIIDLDEV